MAHGRVSVALGVQAGLGAIINYAEAVKGGLMGQGVVSAQPQRNRLGEAEIHVILRELFAFAAHLERENIEVVYTSFAAGLRLELPLLAKSLGVVVSESRILQNGDLEELDLDAVIYVPLDVQQPRQVEQLARLSLLHPRTQHVAFASAPRWAHSQLVALRESWNWVDPKQTLQISRLAEGLISINGGITHRELARIQFPQMRDNGIQEPVIITRSSLLRELLSLIDAVADSDSTIMVTGDSGTGKELVAQRVHCRSHRKEGPFVALNCAAIPEELLESELFGHVKGAFTGAVSNRLGRFEAAEGGTLFLDEIGEMGPGLQVKLLRVLQTRRFEPVGSTKTKNANVRIVAATNRNLEEEVKQGRFREDLFYRLNVIPVHVPSLKERPEDIQTLVEFFVKKFNIEKSRRVTGVTRAGLRALMAYAWPGNVRELENLMERMVILKSSGMIDLLDFPEKYRKISLSEIEFDDLMQQARPAATVVATVGASQQNVMEEVRGEDDMMKINGTFTKGPIQQSTEAIEQASKSVEVEAAPIQVEGSLTVDQAIRLIADKMVFPVEGLDFNSVVDQFENILILQALERTGWNRNRAAGLLRLNRTTLVEKLKKKQLMPPVRYGQEGILEGNA